MLFLLIAYTLIVRVVAQDTTFDPSSVDLATKSKFSRFLAHKLRYLRY